MVFNNNNESLYMFKDFFSVFNLLVKLITKFKNINAIHI